MEGREREREGGEREREGRMGRGGEERSFYSYKATVLSDWGSTLTTSFNFNYLLKTLSPKTATS